MSLSLRVYEAAPHRRTGVTSVACALLCATALSSCGTHRGRAAVASGPAPAGPTSDSQAAQGEAASIDLRPATLEQFIARVRKIAAEARPSRPQAQTIEGSDRQLAAALAAAAIQPTPERYRDVANEYARIGVNDRAYEYLSKSLQLQPRDPATYDALARLWRDSGFPQRGLGDAYRAVYFAPTSPIVRNTLGTILHRLGMRAAARREFERAIELDPTAVYALTNLCYTWLEEGRSTQAQTACAGALDLNPRFAPARNNLALSYAAAGDVNSARWALSRNEDPAIALYNMGLIHLARHEYRDALASFKRVLALRPDIELAAARVRQAEDAIEQTEEEE